MGDFYFLSLGKLTKGKGHLLSAARHNRRAIQAELGSNKNIDVSRTHLNETLMGEASPELVAAYAERLMAEANITHLRKDAVRAVEVLFSLPANHRLDDRLYFLACVKWVESFLGGVILSADIHRDEAVPHCHVLVLPLVNGRMNGSAYVGYKSNLKLIQQSFYLGVGLEFGLKQPPERLPLQVRRTLAALVVKTIQSSGDSVVSSIIWPLLKDLIEREPSPFAFHLGIDIPETAPRPLKTMAQVFTSRGRGYANERQAKKDQNLSCVGFANFESSITGNEMGKDAPTQQEIRIREAEQDPKDFDPVRGDFYPSNPEHKKVSKGKNQVLAVKESKVRKNVG